VNIAGTLVIDDQLTIEGSAFGRIEIGGASGGYIDLKAPNSDDYDFRIITSSGGNEITTATGDLIFNTAETLALTIDTSQNANFEGELQIPSYIRHTGDTNTYIGFSANDTIDLVTASNVVLRIDSSNNATFSGDITAVSFTGNLTGNVTGNVTGDLTGNVTATSVLADGVTATTQSDGDNSTKVATTAYVDTAIEGHDTLAEVLAGGNTTGGTDIAITAGDKITNFTSTGIDDNAASTAITIDSSQDVTFASDISFADDNKILLGDGDDVEMYWDSNGAFVIDIAPFQQGMLITSNTLRASSGTFTYIDFNQAELEFFSLGNEKFKVHQTGVTVTGVASITGNTTIGGDLAVDTDTLFVDASEDSVGIGLTNPSDYSADELVISVPDDSGMTLVSGTTDTAYIRFADGTAAADQANFISHDHNTNTLTVFSQAKVSIGILEAEVAYFTDTAFYVDKSTTIDDTLTVNGNSTFAGETYFNKGVRFYRYTDQANFWSVYTNTDDSLRFNYNGAGNDEITIDTSGNSTFAGTIVSDNITVGLSDGNDSSISLTANTGNWKFTNVQSNRNLEISDTDGTGTVMTIDTSGNVGIGNTNPSAFGKFVVQGTGNLLNLNATSGKVYQAFYENGVGRFYLNTLNGSDGLAFTDADGATERMRIDSSGNVSIGQDVGGSAFNGASVLQLSPYTSGQPVYIGLKSDTSNNCGILMGDSDDSYVGGIIYNNPNNYLVINTNNAERMRIDSSGDVSIKTGYLSIDSVANNSASVAGQYRLALGHDASTDASWIQSNGVSGTQRKLLLNPLGGNVGIGTDSPDYKLHIKETTTAAKMYINGENGTVTSSLLIGRDARNWEIKTDTAVNIYRYSLSYIGTDSPVPNIFTALASGKVGIGTDSPAEKLHIRDDSTDADVYIKIANDSRDWFMGVEGSNSDILSFKTHDASNLLNITSGGEIGIGTTFVSAKVQIHSTNAGQPTIPLFIVNKSTTLNTEARLGFAAHTNDDVGTNRYSYISTINTSGSNGQDMIFATNATGASASERMRITSGGLSRFKSQAGSYGYGSGYNFHEFNNDFGNQPIAMFWQASGSGSHYGINVHNNDDENDTTSRFFMGKGGGTERIKIYSNGNIENTNNSYGQLSDIKLKENVTDATSKLEDLMKVQIKNFNYIGQEQKQIGVIAQELEQIFPNLIYETPKTKREEVNKTDNEGNIIYQTEQRLINEAVEGQEAIEWNEKPTQDNTKIQIQTWLDNNNIEWQSADTKQELLDRIPEYQQEAVEAKEAIYETIETDEPVKENVELATGEVIKGVKYSVFVPMLIKGMQEQQQLINDLKSRIETLENN
jgi:hypothetical protein